ncbi:hypothetical protein CXG81DRAFT_3104, partial [Caulochytrium protostelioides]
MLVLLVGDFHIPHRAVALPLPFQSLLVPGKIHQVLCTGNLTAPHLMDTLRAICPDVHVVQGDADLPWIAGGGSGGRRGRALPIAKTITHGSLRIGLLHGHTVLPWGDPHALAMAARRMDVDVLVFGHTHRFEAYEYEGRFFVNPGSATGALGGEDPDGDLAAVSNTPSFVLLDIAESGKGTSTMVVYIYQLV